MFRFFILSFYWSSLVNAHSWVECTNYDPVSFEYDKLGLFDRSRCRGYPRAFKRQFESGFSVDTGYNWEKPTCRDKFNIKDYDDRVKMAQYTEGQIIYISHPAKNHVADTCTNQFIPSGVMTVKMSSGVGVDTFDVQLTMYGEDHVNGVIDHLEYQRCYNFCEDPDGAHCLTGWVLPKGISEGVHSFMWLWEFNPNQFYSNCFDALISSGNTSTFQPINNQTTNSSSSSGEFEIQVPPTTVPEETQTQEQISPNSSEIPEVISSGSSNLVSPISKVVMAIEGWLNISGLINITLSQ